MRKGFRINEDSEPFGADRQIRTADLILTKSPHFLLRSTRLCYFVLSGMDFCKIVCFSELFRSI